MERMENGWLMTKEDVEGLIKVIDKMSGGDSEGKCEQIVNNSGNSSETNSEKSGFEGLGAGLRKLKENLEKISADFARGFSGESEIGEDLDGPGCEFEDFDEKMNPVQEFWSSFDRIVRDACAKCFDFGVENGISWEKGAHGARVCAKSGISGVVVKEKPSGKSCNGVGKAVDDAKLQLDSALSRYIFEQEGKLKHLVGENMEKYVDNDVLRRAKQNEVTWKGAESDSVFDEKSVKAGQKWAKTGPGIVIFGEKSEENDNVNHPNHYKSSNGIECIDAIEASVEGLTGLEAVCTANVLKYIWRWKKKNGLEDLRKAKWYLEKLIGFMGGK